MDNRTRPANLRRIDAESTFNTLPVRALPEPPQPRPREQPTIDEGTAGAQGTAFDLKDLVSRTPRSGRSGAPEPELWERIRTTVRSTFPVAVLNAKGGVGKTTVVEALGSTLAKVRRDRVIALDIDAGDLADRHGHRNALTISDLLRDRSVTRYLDVRRHTYRNRSGLEVLAQPDYARGGWRVERQHFVRAYSILRNHYPMVLIDCPKELKSAVVEAALQESRALVVVSGTSADSLRKTEAALEWLRCNGHQRLLDSTVLAINHTAPARLDGPAAGQLERLSRGAAAVVALPFDRHVREGREIALERLSRESRRSYLELAAAVVDLVPGRRVERDGPAVVVERSRYG